jgi:HSP20 family molecular chaperone IbpA
MKTNLITRPFSFPTLRDDFFFPMQEAFDSFFDDFFGTKSLDTIKGKGGYPKMEAGIEGNYWIVRVAVPGVKEEDLLVQVDESQKQRVLRIQGQMAEEYQSPEGSQLFVRELRKGKFVREVAIPSGLVGEPEALLKDGVLTLRWEKPPEEGEVTSAVRKIPIKKE